MRRCVPGPSYPRAGAHQAAHLPAAVALTQGQAHRDRAHHPAHHPPKEEVPLRSQHQQPGASKLTSNVSGVPCILSQLLRASQLPLLTTCMPTIVDAACMQAQAREEQREGS